MTYKYVNITDESFTLLGVGFGGGDEKFIPGQILEVPNQIIDDRLEERNGD
jgi:hypothetical protein